MHNISLGYLYIKDFKSFRGENEIILSTTSGLKYINGINEVNPRLGSNGAGKTSLFDAIVWCITNASIRGHRAADLASWGTKSCQVITGWIIDGNAHTLDRTGSPNKVLLDGEPIEQMEIDRLFMPRTPLLHSVIFGQSVDFFYDLDVPKRGELLDTILNLDIWVTLADRAGKKAAEAEKRLAVLSNDLRYHQGLFQGYTEQEGAISVQSEAWEKTWKTETQASMRAMEQVEHLLKADKAQLANLDREIQELRTPIQNLAVQANHTDDYIRNVQTDIALAQQSDSQLCGQYLFFQQHSNCPQCQQSITESFRNDKLASLEADIKHLEEYRIGLSDAEKHALQQGAAAQQEYQAALTRITELQNKAVLLQQKVKYGQDDVKSRAMYIHERLTHPNNPYQEQLASLRQSLLETETVIRQIEADAFTVRGEQIKFDYWRTGFRKVRLYEVKRILARLQLETANAANALGIGDWDIQYSTEVETKSGTLKSGVHITVKEPDGHRLAEESGGEEQRVRLAVSMGISTMVQEMLGVHFTFEAFDEPSAWLSQEGIINMLDQLRDRANSLGKSVWLLDHRVTDYPDFTEIWTVRKTDAGSNMQLDSVTTGV